MKIVINEKANYMILAYKYAKHFINLYFTRRKRNPNNYTAVNIKILSDCIAFDIIKAALAAYLSKRLLFLRTDLGGKS